MNRAETTINLSAGVHMDLAQPLLLSGFVQHYAWGKPGNTSLVAKYGGMSGIEKPCAELWFGTHPKGPTSVLVDGTSQELRSLVAQSPEQLLGRKVRDQFGDVLPFLFKVLSINEALSIQAHPSKTSNPHPASEGIPAQFRSNHAGYLHWKDPAHYPDANHKPEIAVALTTLSLLHGFKPVPELISLLEKTPELVALAGLEHFERLKSCGDDTQQAQSVVRDIYRALVQCPAERRGVLMETYRDRLLRGHTDLTWERAHLEKMFSTYGPQDVGIATSLLMNWVQVAPGNAVYMGPNELHAYLEGDIIECMATSDNVVRAGLTPKFQDTVELLAMAEIVPGKTTILEPQQLTGSKVASVYQTPAREFQLMRVSGQDEHFEDFAFSSTALVLCSAGKILLKTKGHSLELQEGQVAILPATSGTFSIAPRNGEGFVASVPV